MSTGITTSRVPPLLALRHKSAKERKRIEERKAAIFCTYFRVKNGRDPTFTEFSDRFHRYCQAKAHRRRKAGLLIAGLWYIDSASGNAPTN